MDLIELLLQGQRHQPEVIKMVATLPPIDVNFILDQGSEAAFKQINQGHIHVTIREQELLVVIHVQHFNRHSSDHRRGTDKLENDTVVREISAVLT